MPSSFCFDQFVLDVADRRLKTPDGAVDLNGRYFDALALLVRERGKLVSKERFLDEVWHGVPVTDEALTQCIKTLRRKLGDDASRPRFIETVPKHGYRFIAPVRHKSASENKVAVQDSQRRHDFLVTGTSGTVGGAAAGVIGGLLYGFIGASLPAGIGALSTVLVTLCIAVIVAVLGAAGVSFAIAAAEFGRMRSWQSLTMAGAVGGLVIGAVVKLVGIDAFTLLVGSGPARITGAMEGLLIGAAVGLGSSFASSEQSARKAVALSASFGGLSGAAIAALGGHLLLGSLATIEREFPASRLRVDLVGGLFGERGFGPATQMASCALEGALFSSFVVAAMWLRRRDR